MNHHEDFRGLCSASQDFFLTSAAVTCSALEERQQECRHGHGEAANAAALGPLGSQQAQGCRRGWGSACVPSEGCSTTAQSCIPSVSLHQVLLFF